MSQSANEHTARSESEIVTSFARRIAQMKASEIRELLKLLDQPDMVSFAGGIPDPALFPAEAFRDAMGQALSDEAAGAALQYSVSEGYAPLRAWLAEHMSELGVACGPENILITSGSQQALDYLGKLMIDPGDRVLVTWPTYMGALGAYNAYEPTYQRLMPGANEPLAELRKAAEAEGGQAKFAYLSVDFANPTGETLNLTAREAMLDMADALNIAIVEDGAYQALRYDGEHLPSILAMEMQRKGAIEACRTIYCGSFSKTLAPGLRVGWVCAASPVISQLVLMKQASDLHSPTLNQIAINHVARSIFPEHFANLRAVYVERRDAMLAALARHMPKGIEWTRPEGGMFVWLTLPSHMNARDLLERAIEHEKVAFVPGAAFFADGSNANSLRLSFSCTDPATIDDGIARLARVIAAA